MNRPLPPPPFSSPRPWPRRHALAHMAGLAGGLLWFGSAPRAALAAPTQAEAEEALWNLTLPRPDGTPFALQSLRGTPLLVNFWATWCPPCVKEMPLLDQFHRQQARAANGWQVVGIAADTAPKVRPFVQRLGLDFPILVAGPQGLGLAKALGSQGKLPFTLALGPDGRGRERKLGQVQPEDLARWLAL